AGDLEAEQLGGAGRRRVLPRGLRQIRAVHARGDHVDEHLAGAGDGFGQLGEPQLAAADDGDRAHGPRSPSHRPTSTTVRPRTPPARIRFAAGSASPRPMVVVIESSSAGSSSSASAAQARSRSGSGHSTELMPARVTPRRMNGSTVAGRSRGPPNMPAARSSATDTTDA